MIQVVRDGINAKFERDDQYKYRCTSALGLGVHLLGLAFLLYLEFRNLQRGALLGLGDAVVNHHIDFHAGTEVHLGKLLQGLTLADYD